jgi:hypothetical protein
MTRDEFITLKLGNELCEAVNNEFIKLAIDQAEKNPEFPRKHTNFLALQKSLNSEVGARALLGKDRRGNDVLVNIKMKDFNEKSLPYFQKIFKKISNIIFTNNDPNVIQDTINKIPEAKGIIEVVGAEKPEQVEPTV